MSVLELSIPRPDDWHVHLRDDAILAKVITDTAQTFARAIVMPNLSPAVTTAASADRYRARICAALPASADFTPLMTCYLTDATDPKDLEVGFRDGIFTAAKLYPAGATTNSHAGVTDLAFLDNVLQTMQRIRMPLLIHGEVVDPAVDIFDREAVFIDRSLAPLVHRYSELRVVLEHVTTLDGVEFVYSQGPNVAATITPHHLMINRNAIFRGGIRPHFYCLPIAKREEHRLALRRAACSGNAKFFLGTDSAPHLLSDKESACGCAGVYNSATSMACYAQVFDEEQCLERLAGFASEFGADFYGLARNSGTLTLRKGATLAAPADINVGGGKIRHFLPDDPVSWHIDSLESR
ncbi:MAG: dihydroorotase [Proteobacteria bacterium]|nr:dihydroorotase [Pseudomonadota bacterium]